MVERPADPDPDGGQQRIRVRRRWSRVAGLIAVAGMALLVVAIGILWIQRRPIATHYLKNEFEQRGVQASYHLEPGVVTTSVV